MRIVAFIQDRPVIDKILAHIGYRLEVLALPAVPRPPPPPRELYRGNQDYALPF